MVDMVMVRPRTGIILAGIPRKGAEIPASLAAEWIADRLVVRVETPHLTVEPTPNRRAKR